MTKTPEKTNAYYPIISEARKLQHMTVPEIVTLVQSFNESIVNSVGVNPFLVLTLINSKDMARRKKTEKVLRQNNTEEVVFINHDYRVPIYDNRKHLKIRRPDILMDYKYGNSYTIIKAYVYDVMRYDECTVLLTYESVKRRLAKYGQSMSMPSFYKGRKILLNENVLLPTRIRDVYFVNTEIVQKGRIHKMVTNPELYYELVRYIRNYETTDQNTEDFDRVRIGTSVTEGRKL